MMRFAEWIEDCYWSWRNCIEFRLEYNDRIDYCAFWEELNIGYYQEYIYPYDDMYFPSISKERKLRLSQEPETIYLSPEDFDFLVKKLAEPPQYNENLAKLLQRKAPWDKQ